MWILRTDGDPVPGADATAFFLTEGSFIVGRQTGKGVDIIIANDPSISRRHAEVKVGTLDVNSPLTSNSDFQLTGELMRLSLNGQVFPCGWLHLQRERFVTCAILAVQTSAGSAPS